MTRYFYGASQEEFPPEELLRQTPDAPVLREWIGLAVLALPTLLVTMDLSVLFLAVPELSRDLSPSSAELLWITDIYGFLIAGSLITMGTLGDRIGRRKLLMIGAAAFGAASIVAAFSTSASMLIAARALQDTLDRSDVPFDYDVALVPKGPSGRTNFQFIAGVGATAFAVLSDDPEAAVSEVTVTDSGPRAAPTSVLSRPGAAADRNHRPGYAEFLSGVGGRTAMSVRLLTVGEGLADTEAVRGRARMPSRSGPAKPRGNPEEAMRNAPVKIEAEYRIPIEHHNPMEPHGAIAVWQGDKLTIFDKSQEVYNVRKHLASSFNIPEANVQVISPYVGGAGCG